MSQVFSNPYIYRVSCMLSSRYQKIHAMQHEKLGIKIENV